MDFRPAAPGPKLTDRQFWLPRPQMPLAFTGERMTSAAEGQIAFEHYHRYCVARDLCAGRDVLDVASGEGYGAALLADVAHSVVGVEIDAESVDHARASYVLGNLRFLQADAVSLPLSDGCIDVVVSFETLEHVADQARFIGEIRRVLRPGGLLLISTPDREVYSAAGTTPNLYHVCELTRQEFAGLLLGHFARLRIMAQRAVLGSVLAAPDALAWRSYVRRGPDMLGAADGLAEAPYLVAVATDGELPPLAASVYLDAEPVHDAFSRARYLAQVEALAAECGRERDLALLEVADEQRRAEQARAAADLQLQAAADEADGLRSALATATQTLAATQAGLAVTQADLAAARESGQALLRSTSWRITAPLRRIVDRCRRAFRQLGGPPAAGPAIGHKVP